MEKENRMKKNVEITINLEIARYMLRVAGIITSNLTDDEIFDKVLDQLTKYGTTYSIDQEFKHVRKSAKHTPKKLEQTIRIPKEEMNHINKLLTMTGDEIYQKYGRKRDETVRHTAYFPNNIEVDIKLVICDGDDTPFTEAVLFQNGWECVMITPVEYEYGGEWCLEYDGIEYIVNVIAED